MVLSPALPLTPGRRGFTLGSRCLPLLAGKPTGWGVLWTIVRAFAHFPLYGGVAPLSVLTGFAALGPRVARHRLLGGEPPIWFIIMPFNLMGIEGEGDSDVELPETVSTRRLLRWLPAFASFWLGDYLAVAWLVSPVMIARRRAIKNI